MEEQKSRCPYCKIELQKRPVKKSKCKSCGNIIFVKKAPGEFIPKLLTTTQYNEVVGKWADHSLNKAKFHLFNQYGLTEDEYNFRIKPYFHPTGYQPTIFEIELEILKTRVGEEQNYYALENIYSRLSYMMGQTNSDSFELQRLSNLMKLKALKDCRYELITIHCNPEYCPHSKNLKNYKANIEKEIDSMSIPTFECTRVVHQNESENYTEYKICLCSYHPYIGE